MQLKSLFSSMIFHVLFFFLNVEFKAFSNLEDLYLSGNEINDFVTTRGIIVSKNICSWIKIKYFFWMICQMKLSHQCFWDILFCPIDSNILTKLQLLDLSGNDFSARVLESLIAFPSLKTLVLSHNNMEGSFTTKGNLYHGHQGNVVLRFFFLIIGMIVEKLYKNPILNIDNQISWNSIRLNLLSFVSITIYFCLVKILYSKC